jgi:hypothetical protein
MVGIAVTAHTADSKETPHALYENATIVPNIETDPAKVRPAATTCWLQLFSVCRHVGTWQVRGTKNLGIHSTLGHLE